MPKWNDRIARTTYRFMRVSRETGQETEAIRSLQGGRITRNDDTRIKESAETRVVGDVDFGPDLVRVHMTCEWPGETSDVVLGTFLPVIPGRSVRPGYSTSTMKMYGRLQELLDDQFSEVITVEKGDNAVAKVREVCEVAGLEVVADESDYTVTNTRAYGLGADTNNSAIGDTKLDMVNDLLDLAGFRAAFTDPMGRVILRKYSDPADIAPSWSFIEGPSAKFEGSIEEERDYTNAANHVLVLYGPDEKGKKVVGEAWDKDPDSPISTVSRGRTITRSYTYNELPPGKTDGEMQEYANKRAQTLLATAQSVIWRVRMRHAYAPITVNDTAEISFPSGGVSGKFQVRAQTLELGGGCPTSTEMRVFKRRTAWTRA